MEGKKYNDIGDYENNQRDDRSPCFDFAGICTAKLKAGTSSVTSSITSSAHCVKCFRVEMLFSDRDVIASGG